VKSNLRFSTAIIVYDFLSRRRLGLEKEDGRQNGDRRLPAISGCSASSRLAVSVTFPVIVGRLYAVRVSVAIVIS
jgi:hypothetical protein